MREELYLNNLTHIEKLDMYIDFLKKNKKRHESAWSVGQSLDTKNPVELINMMHDYEKYSQEVNVAMDESIGDVPYVQKMIKLYTDVEIGLQDKNSPFNNKMQIKEDAKVMATTLDVKMQIINSFKKCNNRIFKINESLIEKLKLTDVKSDISYIRTPYECIYLQFPPKFSQLTGVEGVYVKQMFDLKEDLANVLGFLTVKKFKFDPINWKNSRDIFTGLWPSTIDLSKKITIQEILMGYKNNNSIEESQLILISTIIKTLMYISSINADTERIIPVRSIQGKKIKFNKKRKTSIPYEYVGGNIIINNHDNFESSPGNSGRQISTKFMVRGHYHGFWMNLNDDYPSHQIVDIKGDKMLVKKWVEPFWKGSEFSEVVLKNYKVN